MLFNDVYGSNSRFFNKSWAQFQQGFGDPSSNYWMGLDMLNLLTTQYTCGVYFDLQSLGGTWYYAQYSTFRIGGPSTKYTLTIGGYTGNLVDAMPKSNNRPFTTYDNDNDNYAPHNCAVAHGGGFWYDASVPAAITYSLSASFRWSSTTLNQCIVTLICWASTQINSISSYLHTLHVIKENKMADIAAAADLTWINNKTCLDVVLQNEYFETFIHRKSIHAKIKLIFNVYRTNWYLVNKMPNFVQRSSCCPA